MDRLAQDMRYAVRMLRRTPGFTAVAIISLALGIGANTAIFSLINTLMLRPLPVRHPQELVELLSGYPGEPRTELVLVAALRALPRPEPVVLGPASALAGPLSSQRRRPRAPRPIDGEYVTGNFFTALGVQPALGRLIGRTDDQWRSASAASRRRQLVVLEQPLPRRSPRSSAQRSSSTTCRRRSSASRRASSSGSKSA